MPSTSSCANVEIRYKGNGTQRLFTFPFTYIRQSHIHVSLWDDALQEWVAFPNTNWSFSNPTTIQFNTAPAAPTNPNIYNIRIYRATPIDAMESTFYPGSSIRAEDLNSSFEQLRYALEEEQCEISSTASTSLIGTAPISVKFNGVDDVISVSGSSESSQGVIQIASALDVSNGVDTTKAVTPALLKTSLSGKIDGFNAALTGVPTAPTAAPDTNSTQIATTAFVNAEIARDVPQASEIVAGRVELATAAETTTGTDNTRAVHPAGLKVELDKKANIASPAFSGTPTAPTASIGTNTTQLATTAFVQAAVTSSPIPDASETIAGKVELATAAETTSGTDNTRAVHPAGLKVELDKKAPLVSPIFTGTPTAPTAAPGTNTTQVATTAYVRGLLASPAFTGVPTAPTAAPGTNTTQVATTAFVEAAVLAGGGGGGGGSVPDATETGKGIVQFATAAEATAGTDNTKAVHPAGLKSSIDSAIASIPAVPNATETVAGKVELATNAEATTGTDTVRAVHPAGLKAAINSALTSYAPLSSPALTGTPTSTTPTAGVSNTQIATTAFVQNAISSAPTVPDASETVAGKVELATSAETSTGTDTTRAVHPAGLKSVLDLKAPLASPAFTGVPTAPTAAAGTNTTQVATTAFVIARTGQASTSTAGLATLATQAEVTAGTDAVKTVTPSTLKGAYLPLGGGALTGALTSSSSIAGTTVSDSKGNLRSIPQNAQTTAYVLVASDAGKHIALTAGGWTIPASVFVAGDAITLFNDSDSDQAITTSAVTAYWAGNTGSHSSFTLAARGIATALCLGTNRFVLSGAGLS